MKKVMLCIIVWALFSTTLLGQNVDELLQHKSSTRRIAAVKMLVENTRGPELINKLKPLTNDTAVSVRVAVAKALGETRLPEASIILGQMRAASKSKTLTDTIDEALKLTGPVPQEVLERLANKEQMRAEVSRRNRELAVKVEEWLIAHNPVSDKNNIFYEPGKKVAYQAALRALPMIEAVYLAWTERNDKEIVKEFLSHPAIVRKEIDAIINESGMGDIQRVLDSGEVVSVGTMWKELKKIEL